VASLRLPAAETPFDLKKAAQRQVSAEVEVVAAGSKLPVALSMPVAGSDSVMASADPLQDPVYPAGTGT